MGILLVFLGVVLALAAVGAYLFIVVEAFRDEIWKGIVALLIGLYWLYYALVDFDHDWKWPIVAVAIFGGAASGGLLVTGLAMMGQ